MTIILLIIIAIIVFIVVGVSSSKKLKEELDLYNKKNNIQNDPKFVTCIELNEQELNTQSNGVTTRGKNFNIWKENNSINLCKTLYANNKINTIVDKYIIPINDIKFFTRNGEYRVDNIVNGGGVNLTGAIVGGVVAGGVGAILGGREKIKTTTKELDKRLTYLYYSENNENKRMVFTSRDYDILLELMPNKDIEFIENNKIIESQNSTQENNNIYEDIEQLSKLKDKGILTEIEFNEKKRILLDKIS